MRNIGIQMNYNVLKVIHPKKSHTRKAFSGVANFLFFICILSWNFLLLSNKFLTLLQTSYQTKDMPMEKTKELTKRIKSMG